MISIEKIKKFPDTPGVYFFKNNSGDVLYIGKATSLRDRVRSYFSNDLLQTRGPLLMKMINDAAEIGFEKTDSVLEALILEANLIKKHKPPANTAEKDDKSFNYVLITKEEFPRVLTRRGKEIEIQEAENSGEKTQAIYGPFIQGGSLREALKIIRKIFPYRDRCVPKNAKGGTGKPCFNKQIGLCPGVCSGEISAEEYVKTIKHIRLFFEGKKKTLVKSLEKEMQEQAKNRDFEKATKTKKTIFALQHIQDIALIKNYKPQSVPGLKSFRIEAYDIAHMSGKSVVGVMTVVEDGEAKRSEYRKFKIRQNPGVNDTAALKEVLERRLNHPEWTLPQVIVVDGGRAQMNAAEAVLTERGYTRENGQNITLVSVVKDERHKPREILGKQPLISDHESEILIANSEAHRFAITFHRKIRGKLE